MKGDFLKVFAFLSWKQREDKRRLRSASISCPRDAFCKATSFAIQKSPNVDGSRLNKQYCADHTVPKNRKLQPYKRERSYSVTGGVCSVVSSSHPQTAKTRNFSTIFDRKRMINVVVEDFEIEHDIRELWGCCRNRGIFSDASVQMVFLRQRSVLRNFEPIYGNGNSTFSMTVHLRGFMVAISVRVPVVQWKRRSTISDYPWVISPCNKPLDGCANSGQ